MRAFRDRLVDDATFRGLFAGVSTTATAPVYPTFMEVTGRYPQVIYSEILGRTRPGLTAGQGQITFNIQVQNWSGTSPHATHISISDRINQLLDDQVVTGLSVTGSAAIALLVLRAGSTPVNYDPQRKVYDRFITYDYETLYQ